MKTSIVAMEDDTVKGLEKLQQTVETVEPNWWNRITVIRARTEWALKEKGSGELKWENPSLGIFSSWEDPVILDELPEILQPRSISTPSRTFFRSKIMTRRDAYSIMDIENYEIKMKNQEISQQENYHWTNKTNKIDEAIATDYIINLKEAKRVRKSGYKLYDSEPIGFWDDETIEIGFWESWTDLVTFNGEIMTRQDVKELIENIIHERQRIVHERECNKREEQYEKQKKKLNYREATYNGFPLYEIKMGMGGYTSIDDLHPKILRELRAADMEKCMREDNKKTMREDNKKTRTNNISNEKKQRVDEDEKKKHISIAGAAAARRETEERDARYEAAKKQAEENRRREQQRWNDYQRMNQLQAEQRQREYQQAIAKKR